MKRFGSTLFILGLLAFGLNYMNAVPKVLAWIYNWGEDTAMWIKAGIPVAALCFGCWVILPKKAGKKRWKKTTSKFERQRCGCCGYALAQRFEKERYSGLTLNQYGVASP